jgi:DNA repair protein RecO (recombination protein O)
MPSLVCEAVLLRAVAFGESDLVVHLLTADAGRFTAIAKSARKSLRRTRSLGGMGFLERARLVDPHLGLRSDSARYALASFLIELLDRLSPEGMEPAESRPLFALASGSLALVERTRPTPTLRLLLELRLLDALGLRPELGRCVRCGREPDPAIGDEHGVRFHVPDGGLVCTACARGLEGLVPISLGTLRALARGLAVPVAELPDQFLGPQSVAEAARLVFRFQRFHVGVELQSERFLERALPVPGIAGPPGAA